MEAKKLNKLSFKEYLEIEQSSGTRHEYHNGSIVAMSGGTIEHGLIAGNLLTALNLSLRNSKDNCRAINSEVKLHIAASNKYLYPDVMLICGPIERSENEQAVLNPSVIFEVLSKSTEAYDRGDKFYMYKQIPTLDSYILVHQYKASIEIFTRKSNLWKISRIEGIASSLIIESLSLKIPFQEIYRDIHFKSF